MRSEQSGFLWGNTEFRHETANAFRLILRGFLAPAAVYYSIIFVLHFFYESGHGLLYLTGLSGTTAVAAILVYWLLRKPSVSLVRVELYSLAIYALIFANILVHHLVHLEVTKLVYFALLTMVVAATGVTLRIVIPVATLSLVTAILLAGQQGPETQAQLAFIAFASSFVATGVAGLMRAAINKEIRARMKVEQMHEAARKAAEIDFLTGLPNRRSFFSRLEARFADAGQGSHLALGLIDLNGFKHINDLYGHVFGDQLLKKVGQRLAEASAGTALVARLGGDEFALLIEQPVSDAALRALGNRICAAVGGTVEIEGSEIAVAAAVGFARRLAHTAEPQMLYEYADFALYRSKHVGGGTVVVFTAEDEAQIDAIKNVEHHLCVGKLDAEMHVEYQPQVLVAENRVVGFEALARWQSPTLGTVAPDVFIRAAERCGVMNRITPILLRKALAEARQWPKDMRLSFNLSARDVVSPESIEQICQVVVESGFAGDRIDFEITETSIMTDFERVRDSLARLRDLGTHIALDDFGVGYSNFQHLDELAIDTLKIDRRFVRNLGSPANPGRVVKTMIEMCTNLGLTCIVEGVETAAELSAVTTAGGAIVQGYHFSRPMRADRVPAFLDRAHFDPGELRDIA
ncbi:MAG: EAL domain-containing protein [Alphaproteobacteria bacterium]|nr:EAL domain-containing protein [Alphaproteobacteria bacterium]